MRRFSSRGHLVTLSEINITPLLDLAFVLLIIFVITTPLLEQTLSLKLPAGGEARNVTKPKDVLTVEVGSGNEYRVGGRKVANDAELARVLTAAYAANHEVALRVRIDAKNEVQRLVTVLDLWRRHGNGRFDMATEPVRRR